MPPALIESIARRPSWVVLGIAILTAVAAATLWDFQGGRSRLVIDPSVDRLLPDDHPDRAYYERTKARFGDDDVVVLAVAGIDVVSPDSLALIDRLTAALSEDPAVVAVHSLATVANARTEEQGVRVEPFTNWPVNTPARRQALAADLRAHPVAAAQLVARDLQATALVLTLRELSSAETEVALARLRGVAQQLAPDAQIWVTGGPAVKASLTSIVTGQLGVSIPAIFAVVAVILLVAFHNLQTVVLPLLTIGAALVWTLATAVALQMPINLVTSIVPPVVMTLGLAYTMHLQAEYFAARRQVGEADQITRRVLRTIGLPLVLTALTTLAGFLALQLNPLDAVRDFSILAAVGIVYAAVLTLTLLPAMLQLIGCGAGMRNPPGEAFFQWAARRAAALSLRWRRPIVIVCAAVLVLGALAATQISVGTDYIRGFKADHPTRLEYEAVNERFSGANPLSVVLEGYIDDTFVQPDVLSALSEFQAWLDEQPEIGATLSLVDQLRLLLRSFGEEGDDFGDSPGAIKQLLLFGGGESLQRVVDRNYSTTKIQVLTRVTDSRQLGALVERIEQRLAGLAPRLRGRVTGNAVLITHAVDDIASGQWISIGVAALVVYAILALLFTSWQVGLIALWPNLLPVAVYFGALGLLGITLNPTTSLIACIVLGVAVDDTIHFLVRFNAEARATASEKRAAANALASVLRPVTFTTVALCAGFAVLCFSELNNQVQFGALAAFTMLVAWVTDVTFTPALGSGVRVVTFWDVVRLDLGADPERSIPLLNGLSSRQARTFALMCQLFRVKAGTRLITLGEDAHDIFVVIDGELQAWIGEGDERRDLSLMGRGVVIGEVGHFGQKRTANVDALSDSRVLRFNDEVLDKLRLRYPRIAAIIYRNLNRIQAERIANTMRVMK